MSTQAKRKAAQKKVNKIAKVKKAQTEEEKDQAFLSDYQKVCNKHRRGLQASPAWRFSQDGNDFRLVINMSVQRWPVEEASALNGKSD